MFLNRKGFTLIELLVVIIIVGILASVAIPLMTGQVARAKKSEAVAAMGSIRTSERAYYSEHQAWSPLTEGNTTQLIAIGLSANDLDGRYFSNTCYSVNGTSGTITCNMSNSGAGAAKASEVNSWGTMNMLANGDMNGNY